MGRDSLHRASVLADRTQAREEAYIAGTNPAANFQQGFDAMHTAGLREQAAAMDQVQAGLRAEYNQARIMEIHQLADVREREAGIRMQELQYKVAEQEAALRQKQIEDQLYADETNSTESIMKRMSLSADGGAEYGVIRGGRYERVKVDGSNALNQYMRGKLQSDHVSNLAQATEDARTAAGPSFADRLQELNRAAQGLMVEDELGNKALPPDMESAIKEERMALVEALGGDETKIRQLDQRRQVIQLLMEQRGLSYTEARKAVARMELGV